MLGWLKNLFYYEDSKSYHPVFQGRVGAHDVVVKAGVLILDGKVLVPEDETAPLPIVGDSISVDSMGDSKARIRIGSWTLLLDKGVVLVNGVRYRAK